MKIRNSKFAKASDEFVIHLKSHDIVHFSLRVESKSGLWYLKVTSKSGFTSGVERRKEDINHAYIIAANFDANDAASISLYHIIQVNLFQKHLFLPQLTHNMTTDCSLDYKFNTYVKIPGSEHGENMLCT